MKAVKVCTLKGCITLTELSAELMSSRDMPCICRSILHQQHHVDAVRQIWHLSCEYMLFATTDQLLHILCLLTQQSDNPTSTQDKDLTNEYNGWRPTRFAALKQALRLLSDVR